MLSGAENLRGKNGERMPRRSNGLFFVKRKKGMTKKARSAINSRCSPFAAKG
jgi:hypothetical protein